MVSPFDKYVLHATHPLENGDGEGGGLAGTRLGLSDAITSSDDGHDSSLLDGRGSLETICVDSSEKVTFELHVVKAESISRVTGAERARTTHLSVTVSQLDSIVSPASSRSLPPAFAL